MTLNPKQELFVNEYLKCFNATRAMKAAGYSERSAGQDGHRLLKNAEIASRIRARLEEAAMEANEVLYHLAQIARGDFADLVDDQGNIDLLKAKELGKTNLIKRVKNRAVTTENSDISEMETEGYDRLRALELIGKHLALFTERVQVVDWQSEIIALLKDGKVTPEEIEQELGHSLAEELFNTERLRSLVSSEGRDP